MKKSLIVIILLSFLFLGGCIQLDLAQEDLQPVTLKLKWLHQAQFAGNYMAKEKGFYADEGLDVEILPFSYEDPTIEAVVNGDAEFGITGASEIFIARSEGKRIKAFAVIFKTNPECVYALASSGIKSPYDLVGKTVGIEPESSVESTYNSMMSKLDIDRSQINEVYIGYDATELLAGDVDASTGYIINEPNQAIEAGYEINTFLFADYGARTYSDVLFTTDEIIENNPEMVESFLRATINGWEYAFENEDETVNTVLEYTLNRTYSHELYMLQEETPLIHTGDSPLGWMEQEEWANIKQTLLEQDENVENIDVSEVYTMQFLEEIYS